MVDWLKETRMTHTEYATNKVKYKPNPDWLKEREHGKRLTQVMAITKAGSPLMCPGLSSKMVVRAEKDRDRHNKYRIELWKAG